MMNSQNKTMTVLAILFAVFMSIPFLVPGMGWTSLFGLIPLLWMDRMASRSGKKRFFLWYYCSFVLWNAITTFWVWNATPGGAVFAILANSIQMAAIFALFRWSKKRLGGILPYLLLAAAWISWERWYLTSAEISWPWLVLGNSFAETTSLIQWYSVTGSLGGSVWVWASNLALFGISVFLSEGRWKSIRKRQRIFALSGTLLLIFGPMIWSLALWQRAEEEGEKLEVVIAQPNFDPYHKFHSLTRSQQDDIIITQFSEALKGTTPGAKLLLTPETFTNDIFLNNIPSSSTFQRFRALTAEFPGTNVLFGASTTEYFPKKPSILSRSWGDGWIETHNSALIVDSTGRYDLFHKSKLVVGTELTPYPKVFVPLDNFLGKLLGNPRGFMARDIGQKEISLLNFRASGREIPIGCAVCYESVYGEYCTGYVRKGARLLTVITNDAWWGDTPGYRQHLSYSRLRAIETGRYIARCGNTGISAIIDSRGRILDRTPWWERTVLKGEVKLSDKITPFVRYGDIPGRASVLLFFLLTAAALFRRSR